MNVTAEEVQHYRERALQKEKAKLEAAQARRVLDRIGWTATPEDIITELHKVYNDHASTGNLRKESVRRSNGRKRTAVLQAALRLQRVSESTATKIPVEEWVAQQAEQDGTNHTEEDAMARRATPAAKAEKERLDAWVREQLLNDPDVHIRDLYDRAVAEAGATVRFSTWSSSYFYRIRTEVRDKLAAQRADVAMGEVEEPQAEEEPGKFETVAELESDLEAGVTNADSIRRAEERLTISDFAQRLRDEPPLAFSTITLPEPFHRTPVIVDLALGEEREETFEASRDGEGYWDVELRVRGLTKVQLEGLMQFFLLDRDDEDLPPAAQASAA